MTPDPRYDGFRIDLSADPVPAPAGSAQWQYPYMAQPAPQPAPQPELAPEPVIVDPAELAPVGPPQYAAPQPIVRDSRRTTLASIITFISLLIALWAILGFLDSMSTTLSSVATGTDKVQAQLVTANKGLASLETKTNALNQVADDSGELNRLLSGINKDMGSMLAGVERIKVSMVEMDSSLQTLEQQLDNVNATNGQMSKQLASLGVGLRAQQVSVTGMRRDVVGTQQILTQVPARLSATNARLAHVNSVVNIMGCRGITNNLQVHIKWTIIPAGAATVYATMIPAGAWGTKADGTPC